MTGAAWRISFAFTIFARLDVRTKFKETRALPKKIANLQAGGFHG